jgi:hypothetical protein
MTSAVTVALPALGAVMSETSSSTAAFTVALPELVSHLSTGANTAPPLLAGTAVVRALAGTATAT